MATAPVTRRTAPAAAAFFNATMFLAETLDWLHLWNWNQPPPDAQLDHFDHGGQHYATFEL